MTTFYLGVDLGQVRDPTTIAIIERVEPVLARFDYVSWLHRQEPMDPSYDIRHLERVPLGTSYPAIVRKVEDIVRRPEIRGRCTVVADGTGVGRAVMDLLREANLDC